MEANTSDELNYNKIGKAEQNRNDSCLYVEILFRMLSGFCGQ